MRCSEVRTLTFLPSSTPLFKNGTFTPSSTDANDTAASTRQRQKSLPLGKENLYKVSLTWPREAPKSGLR